MKYLLAFLMAVALPAFAQTFDTNYYIGRYESQFTRFMKTNSDYVRWQTNLGIGGVIATNLKATNIVWLSTGTHTNGSGTQFNPHGVGTALLFDTFFSNSTANTTYKFYPGTYYTDGYDPLTNINDVAQIKSGQTWEGSGVDVTKFVLTNMTVYATATVGERTTAANGVWLFSATPSINSASNVTFRDMTIDGNTDNLNGSTITNRAIHALQIHGNNNLVERVKFTGSRGNYAYRESFPFYIEGEGNTVRDCSSIQTARFPLDYVSVFTMNVPSDTITNQSFTPNTFLNTSVDFSHVSNGNAGFTVTRGVVIDGCTVVNCRVGYYNDSLPANNMVVMNSKAINVVVGIQNTLGTGSSTNVSLINNVILLNGTNTFSQPNSMRTDNSAVHGIAFDSESAAGFPIYTGQSVGIIVMGNYIDWHGRTNNVANASAKALSITGVSNGVFANNSVFGTAYAPLETTLATAFNLSNSLPGQITWANNRDLRTGKPLDAGNGGGHPDQVRYAGSTNVGSVLTVGTNSQLFSAYLDLIKGTNVSSIQTNGLAFTINTLDTGGGGGSVPTNGNGLGYDSATGLLMFTNNVKTTNLVIRGTSTNDATNVFSGTGVAGTGAFLSLSNNGVNDVMIRTNLVELQLSNLTATFNSSGVIFDALKMSVTDSASATNSRALALLGGSSGTNVILEVFSKGSNSTSISANAKIYFRLHNTNTAHVLSADRLSYLDIIHAGDFAAAQTWYIQPGATGTGTGQPVKTVINGLANGGVALGVGMGNVGSIALSNAANGYEWTGTSSGLDNFIALGRTNIQYQVLYVTNVVNKGRNVEWSRGTTTNIDCQTGQWFVGTNSVTGSIWYLTNLFTATPSYNVAVAQTNAVQKVNVIITNTGAITYSFSNVPAVIRWEGGTAPTGTADSADWYEFTKIGVGNIIIGRRVMANFNMAPAP